MREHDEVILRQRICLGQECHAVFWLCRHCDRGQRYCSLTCRDQARLRQLREANQRHQRSPEGRLDHRDRQREYRERQCEERSRVTDQGSVSITSPALFECERVAARIIAAPEHSVATLRHRGPEVRPEVEQCCRICGRSGRWVDTSPRIFRRR